MRIIGLTTVAALAGAGLFAIDPAMAQADPNGNMHAAGARPAAHGAAAPSRTGRALAQHHRTIVRHRFVRHSIRGRRGFSYGGYPAYVSDGYETGAEPDAYPAETEAPALPVSAPVYAPPTLYPAKYYYSPSPGVYFYRPAFERPRKCNCG